MDYAKQLLGKSLRELTYKDVSDFFTVPRTESDLLEFKSWPPEAKEQDVWAGVYRGMSAFLNSTGGLIIWGAPKGVKEGKREKIYQGALSSLDRRLEKDQIVSSISSQIVPLASGFRLEILEGDNGNRIAVIEIDESSYKPHQYEHVYYMRLDGQSRPAPHHYVEALFKRIAVPNLEGYLKFDLYQTYYSRQNFKFSLTAIIQIFNFSETQNEENVYYRLSNNVARSALSPYNASVGPRPLAGEKGRVVIQNDLASVLANGNPIKIALPFEMTHEDVLQEEQTVIFTLLFGGKYSTPKLSKYILVFRPNETGLVNKLKMTKKVENVLFAESDEIGGMSRRQQLDHFLER
jgi:hypothetical protein